MTQHSIAYGFLRSIGLAAALIVAGSLAARAELHLDITKGKIEPLPIAIPDFAGNAPNEIQLGRDVTQVISADLERSGLFLPIDQRAFIEKITTNQTEPRFADWRIINAQALVTGAATMQPDGRARIEFRLWDVLAEQHLTGFGYTTTPQNWRRIAHIIADQIYKRITGEDGYFDTRVVYISETGPADKRVKRLALMDQDGANHQYLTDGSALVLTPRFSPSAQEITYLSYASGTPRVYLFNIDTGRQESIGDFPGMTFAPRFSPYCSRVVLSRSENGTTNIFVLDLRSRRVSRLTDGNSIDTTPSYSPDGSKIVFNSDRGGSQQLYVMSADGGGIRRIKIGR